MFRASYTAAKSGLVPSAPSVRREVRGSFAERYAAVAEIMERQPEAMLPVTRSAIDKARKAVSQHQIWIDKRLVPEAKGDFRIGAALYGAIKGRRDAVESARRSVYAVAAMLTSCVTEPLLTGLGSAGYMMIARAGETPVLLDFSAAAPGRGASDHVNEAETTETQKPRSVRPPRPDNQPPHDAADYYHPPPAPYPPASQLYRALLADSEKGSQQATIVEMRLTEGSSLVSPQRPASSCSTARSALSVSGSVGRAGTASPWGEPA